MSRSGNLVPVSELVKIKEQIQDKSIYRKNQKRTVYVIGDVAGELESPVYAIMDIDEKVAELNEKEGLDVKTYYTAQPDSEEELAIKWDGEWNITYEVFRDLGAAFAVVLSDASQALVITSAANSTVIFFICTSCLILLQERITYRKSIRFPHTISRSRPTRSRWSA